MKLQYKPQAIKQLKKLPLTQKKKVVRKLDFLVNQPQSGKLLKGELKGLRSLRSWSYRVIYKIISRAIIVYSIAHRKSVYN